MTERLKQAALVAVILAALTIVATRDGQAQAGGGSSVAIAVAADGYAWVAGPDHSVRACRRADNGASVVCVRN